MVEFSTYINKNELAELWREHEIEAIDMVELTRRFWVVLRKHEYSAYLNRNELVELERELEEFKSIFERAMNALSPPTAVTPSLPIFANPTTQLEDCSIAPMLELDVDTGVEDEVSIILHPLESHTQAFAFSKLCWFLLNWIQLKVIMFRPLYRN